jgi:general nucleoside transport system permease protein
VVESVITSAFVIGIFSATIRMATPLIFAMAGELIIEKSGVLNLGIEGMMVLGASVAFIVSYFFGSSILGIFCAGLSGSIVSLILALLSVSLGINQIVIGLGVGFACTGFGYYMFRLLMDNPTVVQVVPRWPSVHIPFLSDIPFIGPIFFQHNILVYVAVAVVALIWFVFYWTSWGLNIRTVGQVPRAADITGVSVFKVRYLSLIAGGFLIGVGGGFISVAYSNMFMPGLIAGRGWIAIAIVLFGGYRPWRCFGGAILFGFIDAFQLRLQTIGIPIPTQLLSMLPYAGTVIVLALVSRGTILPAALMTAYKRE